jgi:hypothetical protein
MSTTFADQPAPEQRHLAAVGGRHAATTRPAPRPVPAPADKPALTRAAGLRLDQAELFLLSLDNEMLTADSLRAAYLLGLAEVHLAGMIELVRAVIA